MHFISKMSAYRSTILLVYLSTCEPIYLYVFLPVWKIKVHLPSNSYNCLFLCPSIHSPICLPIYPPTCTSVFLSHPPIHLNVCQCVLLHVNLSIPLPVHLTKCPADNPLFPSFYKSTFHPLTYPSDYISILIDIYISPPLVSIPVLLDTFYS